MRLNYKKIGDYIRLVDERNKDLKVSNLLGLTISKKFIPSVANTVGTNMKTYKVIKKNQFACSLMQVRRDKKIPIAIYKGEDSAIISQAYPMFEVIDENILLPDYLMMWFLREEFDRESCFYAVGGVRGSVEWEDFCDMEFPLLPIEKQRALVKEYNVVKDRIELNNNLIQKLEETAQAIYKQWFVDFEFPNKDGKPYKSSGGEMIWCKELEKDVPKGWEVEELGECIDIFDSQRIPLSGDKRDLMNKVYPYYGAASLMDYVDDYIFDGEYILLGEDGTVITKKGTPVLQYVYGKFWVNNHAHILKGKNGFNENSLFMLLSNTNISDIITGGVQAKVNQINLKSIKILKPESNVLEQFNKIIFSFFNSKRIKEYKNRELEKIKKLLLSRLATINN